MKPDLKSQRGLTLVEVLVIVAVLGLLVVAILPALMRARPHTKKITCVNLLKQLGLGYRLWAGDHNDRFPMHVSTNQGGSLEWVESGQVWRHYLTLSNELSGPDVLKCFADSERTVASEFGFLRDSNISYFIGLAADESRPEAILSGDRNLTRNGVPIGPGLIMLATNWPVGWSGLMHQHHGNIGLADGSVQQVSEARLREALQNSGQTNRLLIP